MNLFKWLDEHVATPFADYCSFMYSHAVRGERCENCTYWERKPDVEDIDTHKFGDFGLCHLDGSEDEKVVTTYIWYHGHCEFYGKRL